MKKRIIIIGGSGTIGSAISKELSARHEIVIAGRKSGDLQVDLGSAESIRQMFARAGKFDAVIVAAGDVHFEPFSGMTSEKYQMGLNHKVMGQVNVVLFGSKHINDGGSFTLTSGVLSEDPIPAGSAASMANRALDGFVVGASIELPRGIRLNAVSPTILTESVGTFGGYFLGYPSVAANRVALSYVKSVEGLQTGRIYQVWE